VTLKSERGLQEAQSPEHLIKDLYGWDLPVSSLEFWVKALPMPFDPFEMDATAEGLPRELRQNNWSIVYSEYIVTQGIVLPSRIKLNNPLMKITIKVQHWDL
jgi:outer membrane lipoprotein LolB